MTGRQVTGFLWLGWIVLCIVVMVCVASDMATVQKVKEDQTLKEQKVVRDLQQQIHQLQVQQQQIQKNGN
tara:strand:- start:97 stop:306 length:210 start_codon:yes stop_codon:yes gene_type:complete